MKKIILILLSVCLVASLAACAGGNGTPEASTSAPESSTSAPDAPASTPDAPASTPDAPASTPDAPASTPDAPASTPDAPASTPGTSNITPGTSTPTPGTLKPKPGTLIPTPGTFIPMPDTSRPKPGTIYPVTDTTIPTPDIPIIPEAVGAISRSEWEKMIAEENFVNYTLAMSGKMTTTVNGVLQGISSIGEKIKITEDKMLITVFDDASASEPILLTGDMAYAQRMQYEQIFCALLDNYDSFVYDAKTGTYKVTKTVIIEDDIEGINFNEDGSMSSFTTHTIFEIREAELTVSKDGKLVSFVCDYTQKMELAPDMIVSASGITTWTFSDFGTTVIE